MVRRTISQKRLNAATKLLVEQLHPAAIWLYGSAAAGRLRPDSDVDLAVLCQERPDPLFLFRLRQDLVDILEREVDLISMDYDHPVLTYQVVKTGRVLRKDDPSYADRFIIPLCSMVEDLEIVRRPVVEAFKRGVLHG